ncbi:Wall-associated receptor kinase-like [Thalictrum thalictroides]|uniref:Wall-associated receptor kinase-like n=1 Tax=Thalictrum thalictroides TaxID=46969 RepID=A0A7J6V7P3_THATH|nr:Wall-associated receptor kinase-like [Thalictrum thalictroides]
MKIKSKFEGKDEYFIRNGALLLEKQIASCEGKGIAIRIFTAEELTPGCFTHEVILLSTKAIWRVESSLLKFLNYSKQAIVIDFFLNRVVTQIQINHKYVVKLFGCCVETEIPILVQDFIPNDSLSNQIASKVEPFPWCDRLRIADAATYLHCVNSNPILHINYISTLFVSIINGRKKSGNFSMLTLPKL